MTRSVRNFATILACLGLLSGCPSSVNTNDGGDAAPDGAVVDGGLCREPPIHSLNPTPVYVRVGGTAQVMLRLGRDRSLPGDYRVVSDNPAQLAVPAASVMAHIDRQRSTATFTISGVAAGHATLRVSQVQPVPQANCRNVTIAVDVEVLAPTVPACAMATPVVMGRVAPGMRVAGPAGSPLERASVSAPPLAMNIPATDVTLRCAPDQVPAGYDSIGPAVTIGPGRLRFERELGMTLPINAALVPSFYELHTEVSYTAPGWTTPRIVALADTRFSHDGRALMFRGLRLGTYQAVIRRGIGTRRVRRHYTYRALLGVSMGAAGSSMIGTRHPEMFDFILPLGAPTDWNFFSDMMRRWVLGGFCTEADRATMGAACDMATNVRSPVPHDLFMADQNFEFFNYPTGTNGQGGVVDRHSYGQIMFDLSSMFGNPFLFPDPANGRLPMGVPAAETMRPNDQRCSAPVVLGGVPGSPRYYDDEYNPTGAYPVITFCDGNRTTMNAGEWAGGQGRDPFDSLLAVDRNRNGLRDRGEPVIRNFFEPFEDVGADGLPNAREAGYDAANNPDPAGDDFDRQYNPGGTEGNFVRDEGEPYQDLGLDGVRCPAGEMCPYDTGEGNGRFDTAPGYARMREFNGRDRIAAMTPEAVDNLQMWIDGGVRDFYNFGTSAHQWAGAVSQRGGDLHIYGGFAGTMAGHFAPNQACTQDAECARDSGGQSRVGWFCDRGTCRPDDEGFNFTDVDYEHLPRHNLLRYGHEDITNAQYILGDGGHVGTVPQITNRMFAGLWYAQSHWPTLSRDTQMFSSMPDNAGRCANGYFCSFDFRSDRANRTGPVSIYLPPGYHRVENAMVRYPVVYFLHGYGQEPQDLIASGILVGNYMSSGQVAEWQRPGKFIMVFPDGRCRPGDGCTRGTFYVDSPIPGNARMETYFLDLNDFVGRTYRARTPEDVDTVE